jgi:hypothetical protein
MRKSIRFAMLAGVIGAVLATSAAGAPTTFNPKLIVKPATTGTNFRVSVGATDEPTARFVLYAPVGSNLAVPLAPGTALGPVSAHAAAADLGGAVLPLTGNVLVANPADPLIIGASAACDPVPHVTVLVLNLQAAGQVLNVPIFVDQPAATEVAFASLKMTICLPPPDVPAGTPGRATFGAKLIDADFTLSALTGPTAAGQHRWRSLWTPYTPLVGQVNAAGTVETQSLVFQPISLTLKTKTTGKVTRVKKKRVVRTTATVSGTLMAGAQPAPGQPVVITANGKRIGTVTTKPDGTFSLATRITKATVFGSTATSADRDLGASACTPTLPTVRCLGTNVAGGSVTSNTARAVPRR